MPCVRSPLMPSPFVDLPAEGWRIRGWAGRSRPPRGTGLPWRSGRCDGAVPPWRRGRMREPSRSRHEAHRRFGGHAPANRVNRQTELRGRASERSEHAPVSHHPRRERVPRPANRPLRSSDLTTAPSWQRLPAADQASRRSRKDPESARAVGSRRRSSAVPGGSAKDRKSPGSSDSSMWPPVHVPARSPALAARVRCRPARSKFRPQGNSRGPSLPTHGERPVGIGGPAEVAEWHLRDRSCGGGAAPPLPTAHRGSQGAGRPGPRVQQILCVVSSS